MNCFAQIIEKELKEGSFFRFDTFLMEYLGFLPENGTEKTEELRKLAYRSFLHRVDTDKPASLPTIRR